ncbi:MAG: polyprenyl synthetase family protein [bacterium]
MAIADILFPIEENLEAFSKYYKSLFSTKVSLLSTVLSYINKTGGKKIRPALVLLSAGVNGTINERTYIGASLVELLHNATLVHDDVVDEAKERRGFPSINSVWNNKTAILVGDYLLGKGLLTAIERNENGFLKIISDSVKRMSEGELLALEKSKNVELDEETYLNIISNKTASLLSAGCKIGAESVGASEEVIQKMKLYGEFVGLAFQIKDDIFDYISNANIIGKPTGNDIKEKRITLPLVYVLKNVKKSERIAILKIIKKKKIRKDEIAKIVDFVVNNGGIKYAQDKAENYSLQAIEQIKDLPDNDYKESLIDFAKYAISRKK